MAQRTKRGKGRPRRPLETVARRKSRHLEGVKDIDERDYDLLKQFVTEHGKIIPSRLTGATARQQRQIKRGVRNARTMGLLP